MPSVENVQKKVAKIPAFLLPALSLMAEGKGTKAAVAKKLNVKESSAGSYLGKITTILGIAGMPKADKLTLLGKLTIPTGDAAKDSTTKPSGNGAQAPKSRRQSAASGEPAGGGSDSELLAAFAASLGGGTLAEAIGRVIESANAYESCKPVIEAIKSAKLT